MYIYVLLANRLIVIANTNNTVILQSVKVKVKLKIKVKIKLKNLKREKVKN